MAGSAGAAGPRQSQPTVEAEKLLRPFMEAVRQGDMDALLAAMADYVVLASDGGGKAHPLVRPMYGARPQRAAARM